MINCTRCNGKGRIHIYTHHQSGLCFKCNGSGRTPGTKFQVGSVYSWLGIRRGKDGARYTVTFARVRILEREHDDSGWEFRCEVLDDPSGETETIWPAHMGPDAEIGTVWEPWSATSDI
jgi:hypothetical protein